MTTKVFTAGGPASESPPSDGSPESMLAPASTDGLVASIPACDVQNGNWLVPDAESEQPPGVFTLATYTVSLSVAQWPSRWNMQTPGPGPVHSESALQLRHAC